MAYRFEYPSLIIFDCDDGRYDLFLNHIQFVKLMISTCECHVFWNDRNKFMLKRLNLILKQFPRIHLRPSYGNRTACTTYARIENFLWDRIEEFSSIRLVHGKNYCYEEISEWITKNYGPYKLQLLQLHIPYERFIQCYIKATYTPQFKHVIDCNFVDCPEKFLPTNKRDYDAAMQTYLAECTAVKRLRKDRQKSQIIFYEDFHHDKILPESKMIFLQSPCYCLQCQNSFTSTEEYSQHLCVIHNKSLSFTSIGKSTSYWQGRKTGNLTISNSLNEKLICPFCSSSFTSIRNWDKHIDGKHNDHNLFGEGDVADYLRMLAVMAIEQKETTKPMFDSSGRVACWECSRKFSPEDRLNHYIDKHGTALRSKVIKVSNMYSSDGTAVRDSVGPEKSLIHSRRDKFKCWECDEIFECDAHLLIHFLIMHTDFQLKQAIDPSRELRYQLALAQEGFAMLGRKFAREAQLNHCSFSLVARKLTDTSVKQSAFPRAVVKSISNNDHVKQTQIKSAKKSRTKHISNTISVAYLPLSPRYRDESFSSNPYLVFAYVYSCASPSITKSIDFSYSFSTESTDDETIIYAANLSTHNRTFPCRKYFEGFLITCDPMLHCISDKCSKRGVGEGEKDMKSQKMDTPCVKMPLDTLTKHQKSKSSKNRGQHGGIFAILQKIKPSCVSKKNNVTKKNKKPANSSVHSNSNPSKDSQGWQLATHQNLDSIITEGQVESDYCYSQTSAREHTTVPAYPSDSSKRFPCSTCSKQFRTNDGLWNHFIAKHTALPHSSTTPLSHVPSNCAPNTQTTTNSRLVENIYPTEWYGWWQPTEEPAPKTNLTVPFDLTNILQKKFTTEKKITIQATESYTCSQCSKEFRSHTARASHYQAKHKGISMTTTNPLSNHPHEKLTSIQNSKTPVKSSVKTTATASQHSTSSSTSKVVSVSDNIDPNLDRAETLDQNWSIKTHKKRRIKNVFSCWICSQNFQSARIRLQHFLKTHSSSFLPITNRTSGSSNNHLTKSTSCWQCGRKFSSFDYHISHFIEAHAKDILIVDTDPSSILRKQLTPTKKSVKNTNDRVNPHQAAFNYWESKKKPQPVGTNINQTNETHISASSPTTYKLPNALTCEMKTEQNRSAAAQSKKIHLGDTFSNDPKYWQQFIYANASLDCIDSGYHQCKESLITTRLNNTESRPSVTCKTSFTSTSKYEQEQRQESNDANGYAGPFRSNYPQMNSSVNHDNTQCPRAAFSRLVYISRGTYRQQISVAPGKTNRCPHKLCASIMAKYTFEELCSHIFEEHEDIGIQLECCDPMVTYTPEEYDNHLRHFD